LLAFAATLHGQDFLVQVGAFERPAPDAYFKERGLRQYRVSTDQLGIYRYFAGAYQTRDEAEQAQAEMRARGFDNAIIIDLAEQRVLCGVNCPWFTEGRLFYDDPNHRHIYFDIGSYAINKEGRALLDEIIRLMRANPKMELIIQGHSDATGSKESNVRISISRARTVRNYLIDRGIRADRMLLKIFGESEPMYENFDDENRPLPENQRFNRRVTLIPIGPGLGTGRE
ncbi:MAG: OmpA family protein, partial [Saprospiraceae bacterium]